MSFFREVLKYKDPSTPLADTDLDILAKSESGNKVQKEDTANGSNVNSPDSLNVPVKCKDGTSDSAEVDSANQSSDLEASQTALKLSFTLPSSCYATMAIRELLKTSTSVRS